MKKYSLFIHGGAPVPVDIQAPNNHDAIEGARAYVAKHEPGRDWRLMPYPNGHIIHEVMNYPAAIKAYYNKLAYYAEAVTSFDNRLRTVLAWKAAIEKEPDREDLRTFYKTALECLRHADEYLEESTKTMLVAQVAMVARETEWWRWTGQCLVPKCTGR